MAVTGTLEQACVHGWLPLSLSIYFTVAFVAAIVLLIPPVLDPLAGVVTWLLSPVLRLEGRLAYRQVCRRPLRTALTAGVLYIAVTIGVGLGTTVINNVNDVRKWSAQTLAGDFYVRAMMTDTAHRGHGTNSGRYSGGDTSHSRRHQCGHDSDHRRSRCGGPRRGRRRPPVQRSPQLRASTCLRPTRPRCVKTCWQARWWWGRHWHSMPALRQATPSP